MMLAVGLSYMAFIMLKYVPSMPTFWRGFITNGCLILSGAVSASVILQFINVVLIHFD